MIVWEYEVALGDRAAFIQAYGPDGAWDRLFRQGEGYLGLELLEGENGRFVTLDRWRSEADFEAFMTACGQQYRSLDRQLANLSLGQRRLGAFVSPPVDGNQ